MRLAENIYRFRTERNMSQLELADALEVSRQSVSKWETGAAVPELDKLVKMAKLFEISLDELVNGEASPTQEAPAPAEAPEPRVIYVEKPVFPTLKRQYIIGAVLLFLSLIYGVILYEGFSMEETVSLVLPVAACGTVFLLTSHPLFWCGWICAFGYCICWKVYFDCCCSICIFFYRCNVAYLCISVEFTFFFHHVPCIICKSSIYCKCYFTACSIYRFFICCYRCNCCICWFFSMYN